MQKGNKKPEKCTMYGKLINRLKQGCKNVTKSARSLRTSSQSNSSEANSESGSPPLQKDKLSVSSSNLYHNYALGLIDTDSSPENIRDLSPSTSVGESLSTLTAARSSSGSSVQEDQFWIGFINSQTYKNWLKVGLALRSVCTFLTPILEEIVHDLHSSLLAKHGYEKLTQQHIEKYKLNTRESDMLRGWMRDVLKLHRHPPTPGEVFRISNVVKWPTCDGAWEVARVYMSKGYRTGGDGEDASAFDVSALLNFMYRCRLVDKYVYDFNSVKNVLQVRNTTMHNPSLQVSDEDLEESFQTIFNLLKDPMLKRHAEKYFSTESFYDGIEELKSASFDLVTSAKHSLNLLKDDMFDPQNSVAHPSAMTLSLLRDVLSKILNLPQVEVSADFNKLQSHISEMENKVVQEYVEADKKIQKISAHVDHMNQKLDHLRNFIAKSKTNKIKSFESTEDTAGPARKRKRKREPSPESLSKNLDKKPFPTANGILLTKSKLEQKAQEDSEMIRNFGKASSPINKHVHFDKSMVGSITSSSAGSYHTSNDSLCTSSGSDTNSSSGSLTSSSSFDPESEKLQLHSLYSSPSYQQTVVDQKRIIVDTSEDEGAYEGLGPPLPKRARSSSFSEKDRCIGNKELTTSQLIVFPTTGGIDAERSLAAGNEQKNTKGETFLVSRLQSFLRNQPNNEGATFTIRLNYDKKYYCSVSFSSCYAVSSPNLAHSIEEAKEKAAAEAKRQILENLENSNQFSKQMDSNDISAKTWFDKYATSRTEKPPVYTCFRTNTDLYVSYVQLANNFLLQPDIRIDERLVFLQATKSSTISTIDLKRSVAKSALEQTDLPVSALEPENYFTVLGEYCLENGGTIPIRQTTVTEDPETGRVTRTCVLRSFRAEFFVCPSPSQSLLNLSKDTEEAEEFQSFSEELIQAQSNQGHRNQHLAEESAAFNMLKKLGVDKIHLAEIQGSCKEELKELAKDLDLTIAYHSPKMWSKDEQPLYNCVVTSTCLNYTQENFTATSDSAGCSSEREACESAAQNALLLLGMEIVLDYS